MVTLNADDNIDLAFDNYQQGLYDAAADKVKNALEHQKSLFISVHRGIREEKFLNHYLPLAKDTESRDNTRVIFKSTDFQGAYTVSSTIVTTAKNFKDISDSCYITRELHPDLFKRFVEECAVCDVHFYRHREEAQEKNVVYSVDMYQSPSYEEFEAAYKVKKYSRRSKLNKEVIVLDAKV